MLRVAFTDRVIRRNVGGNSTYTNRLVELLPAHDVMPVVLAGPNGSGDVLTKVRYVAWEGLRSSSTASGSAELIHYTADTGSIKHNRLPIVSTLHGIASLHVAGVRRPVPEKIWRARIKRLAAVSDGIITVSESSAQDISQFLGIDRKRIHVIHHGVDHERFTPAASHQNDEDALREYSLPQEFALYLGNLDPRKNVSALIDAFDATTLGETLPLVVAGGKAWGSEHLLSRLSSATNVIYLGKIPDAVVAPLLRAASLFLFPSFYEGFGFPVLEAMACGTPVACSDRGSLKEVAADSAAILGDLSADGIRRSVLELAHDEHALKSLRQAGLQRASVFTWENSIARHADLYRALAGVRN